MFMDFSKGFLGKRELVYLEKLKFIAVSIVGCSFIFELHHGTEAVLNISHFQTTPLTTDNRGALAG